MMNQELLEMVSRKWEQYNSADFRERLALLRHEFEMHIDDVGVGWEYVHITLDHETSKSYRISYIGPDVRQFVSMVFSLGLNETAQFTWCNEPGEYTWLLSRQDPALYVEAPGIEEGFFIRYNAFRDALLSGYEEKYGWGYNREIRRIAIPSSLYEFMESIDFWDEFDLVRFLEDGHSFDTTDPDQLLRVIESKITDEGMENGKLNERGEALQSLYESIKTNAAVQDSYGLPEDQPIAAAASVRIEHVAMYVNDLEGARDFFVKYLGGRSNDGYHNKTTGFRSYFIRFKDGARLEVMNKEIMTDPPKELNRTGYAHIAFSVGSQENVDELTKRLKEDGYEVVSGPRTTGDGYYESCIVAVEGNQIEITV